MDVLRVQILAMAALCVLAGCDGCAPGGSTAGGPGTVKGNDTGATTASGTSAQGSTFTTATASSTPLETEPPDVPAKPFPSPQEAAAAGLQRLAALVDEETFTELGFSSVGEVANARLGRPIERRFVGLVDLKGRKPQDPLEKIAPQATHFVFPVQVDGKTKALVIVESLEEGWAPTELGRPATAKRLDAARAAFAKKSGASASKVFFLWIPALGADVAVTGGGLEAKAGFSGQKSSFDKWQGTPATASDVLAFLAQVAANTPDEIR